MPLPVIANCFQASLIWNSPKAPRAAVNTLHFKDTAGTKTETDLFNAISANVNSTMFSGLATDSRIVEVAITSLNGSAAGQTFATTDVAKWKGGQASDIILQGAIVLSLKSAVRGPRGRNRIFLPWVAESVQANGTLDPANVANMAPAWATFAAALSTAGLPLQVVSALYQQQLNVTSLAIRGSIKTQRRRARR